MDGVRLHEIVRLDPRTNYQFLGVYAADELPLHMPSQTLAIVNCCNRPYPGEHWLALYKYGDTLEIFDSYGLDPSVYNLGGKFPQSSVISYNTKMIQSVTSNVCGQYCLYYCYYRVRGYTMDDIVSRFSKDYINNDNYAYSTVLKLFNLKYID
jgi:hypothetical protein